MEGHRVSPQAGGRGWTGLGLGGRGVDHRGAAPGWGRGCWCWRLLLAFRFLLSVLSVILEQTVAKAILSPEGKNICDTYRGLKSRRSRDCRRGFFDDEVCRSIFYIYMLRCLNIIQAVAMMIYVWSIPSGQQNDSSLSEHKHHRHQCIYKSGFRCKPPCSFCSVHHHHRHCDHNSPSSSSSVTMQQDDIWRFSSVYRHHYYHHHHIIITIFSDKAAGKHLEIFTPLIIIIIIITTTIIIIIIIISDNAAG